MARTKRLIRGFWFTKTLVRAVFTAALITLGAEMANAQGYVYVGTNEGGVPGANTIRVFYRDGRGLLTELSSSPVSTGGTGVHPTADLTLNNLGPFDSDQCVILDPAGNRLFAVNGGSDSVAVFNVGARGALGRVKGSPFSSHGVNPSSVGLTKDGILLVANKDYDLGRPGFNPATRQGSYTSFKVNHAGQLAYVPGSSFRAGPVGGVGPHHPTPTQMLVSKDGRIAFDANFFGLELRSFQIAKTGQLQPADSQTLPLPAGTNGLGLAVPLGLQIHPTLPVLYCGFVLDQAFGIYVFDPNGKLTFVKAVTGVGSGPCWFLINAAGTRLYTSNNFDNSVSVFDITNPLNPVKIQQVTLAQGPAAASPFQLALDKKGKFLHVVTQAATATQDPFLANGLNVLKVLPDGRLVVVDFVPIPSGDGSRPQGVAAK
jgi:6-phosphogluconolactonase (cycloisomerase 2 family)